METITNPQIAELAESLAARMCPTREQVLQAMALAYNMGKSDGAIEALERLKMKDVA